MGTSKQADMVEIKIKVKGCHIEDDKVVDNTVTKMVPRTKVSYVPMKKDVIIPNVGKKRIVVTHDVSYIKDEGSGALIRMGKGVKGKAAKKAAKREKVKIRNQE